MRVFYMMRRRWLISLFFPLGARKPRFVGESEFLPAIVASVSGCLGGLVGCDKKGLHFQLTVKGLTNSCVEFPCMSLPQHPLDVCCHGLSQTVH